MHASDMYISEDRTNIRNNEQIIVSKPLTKAILLSTVIAFKFGGKKTSGVLCDI